MKTRKQHVLVSVWNDFHAVPLVEGLVRGGFDVTYHHTGGKKARGARDVRNWPAAILNHAGFRRWMSQEVAFRLSRKLVDIYAARLCRDADVFWGWSGCSLKALRLAKRRGIIGLLERGSTHCEWQRSVVGEQFAKHGMGHLFHYSDSQICYDKKEYAAADRICVPSRFVAQTFPSFGVPERQLFINPYGVDVDFWSRCDSAARADCPWTFLYVASIGLRKGIAELLEAWKIAALPDARLLLVGGFSREAQLFMNNLPRNVELRGFASHEDIRRLMGGSHAYVLPSYEEGLARSVLEAAAAGLAPVITVETGATDLLQDGRDCWVIPSGNATALANVLREIAASPDEAARRGRNAAAAVSTHSWFAYGDRAAEFLKTVAGTSGDAKLN